MLSLMLAALGLASQSAAIVLKQSQTGLFDDYTDAVVAEYEQMDIDELALNSRSASASARQLRMDSIDPQTWNWASLAQLADLPIYADIPENADFDVGVPLSSYARSDPLTMVAYHKTGFSYAHRFLQARAKMTHEKYRGLSEPIRNNHSVDWPPYQAPPADVQLQLISMPRAGISLPKEGPVIHWVREPVELIASAYRYHMQTPEGWESKLTTCHACNDKDWAAMFSICDYACSFKDLVTQSPVEKAALIEALNERGQTERMISNLFAWSADPRVLHLSVQHLAVDYRKTMICMSRFLGNRQLNHPQTLSFESLKAKPSSDHVTAGKFNNTALVSLLEASPIWMKQFEVVRTAMKTIFERQAKLFGCPTVPM